MRFRLSNIFIIFPFIFTIFIFVKFKNSSTNFDEKESQVISIPNECVCESKKTGKLYNFCYNLPENKQKRGKRFSCKFLDFWERFEESKSVDIKTDQIPNPVFVTAFSSGFISNAVRMISSIRKLGISMKIVIYDLGLTPDDNNILKQACNIEIRKFDFSIFPESMKELREYRWKPIVIAECLADFGSIWYLDTSVVLEKSNISHVYDLINCQKENIERLPLLPSFQRDIREKTEKHEDGWNKDIWLRNLKECRKSSYLLHGYSGHGILSVTNPEVYNWIPSNFEELRKEKAKMYDAGFVYAVNTKTIMLDIMKWYVLCALENSCMGPENSSLICSFENDDRFKKYAECHRYDQSIINLLLANANFYDRRYYVSEIVDFFHIKRNGNLNVNNEEMQCI